MPSSSTARELLGYILGVFLVTLLLTPCAFAQRIEGIASWYDSSACQGECLTASGDSLRRLERVHIPFVAHRSLPFYTRLKICHGSKCVVGVVLDRGPHPRLKSRILDLSKSLFKELAPLRVGIIPVSVYVLS